MSFLGKDGFVWWIGVVEDRFDPLYLGRCKVRILGWHTKNKAELPTDALPWCMPIQPITSAAQTGVGISPTGVVEGSWVFGFYRDGHEGQEPMMLGSMGGIPQSIAKQNEGFNDPRNDIEYIPIGTDESGQQIVKKKQKLVDAPRDPDYLNSSFSFGDRAIIQNRGPGSDFEVSTFPDKRYVKRKEPTTPRFARGFDEATARNVIEENGQYAYEDGYLYAKDKSRAPRTPRSKGDTDLNDGFVEEKTGQFKAEYPYNHVHQSESGHVIEIDDTPLAERLHWFHRSGSYTEMQSDGDVTHKSVSDTYRFTHNDDYEVVGNDKVLNVQGNLEIFANQSNSPNNDLVIKVGQGGDAIIRTNNGDIVLDADKNNIRFFANSMNFEFKEGLQTSTEQDYVLTSKTGSLIFQDEDEDEGIPAGQLESEGTLSLIGKGAFNIQSGGPSSFAVDSLTTTIGLTSVENVLVSPDPLVPLPEYGKEINATFGKIKLESVDSVTTGGIEINTGLGGVTSYLHLSRLGNINVYSKTGSLSTQIDAGDIETFATAGDINVEATKGDILHTAVGGDIKTVADAGSIEIEASSKNILFSSKTKVDIESEQINVVAGTNISLGQEGAEEPILLGKKFLDEFLNHTHPSGTGPTGIVQNGSVFTQTLSKKVFGS